MYVYAENFTSRNQKWMPGIIDKITGPLSYVIKLSDGVTIHRHVDHEKALMMTMPIIAGNNASNPTATAPENRPTNRLHDNQSVIKDLQIIIHLHSPDVLKLTKEGM